MIDTKSRIVLAILLTAVCLPIQAQRTEAQRGAPPPQNPPPGAAPGPVVESAADAARRSENEIDIYTLLEQVAANEQIEFVVDPRVRARVLGIPKIEDADFEDLVSVLRVHGYMAVEIEGRVHVVPDAIARQMPTRLVQRDDPSISDDEVVTRVLTLDTENAALLVPVLRPLLPVYAHLAAIDNRLVIVDRYDNVRRITELATALTD